MELNPASASRDVLETLRRAGATRLSFGVQSFDDGVLRRAGRRHGAQAAREAVREAGRLGFRDAGIDLIAGLPGDGAATWRATLEETLRLGVKHVSVYALTVEPGTPLAKECEQGAFTPLEDGEMLERLALAEELLGKAGFVRYEISNYAPPGFECRHNLATWRGEDYLGLGPSAASRIGLRRWMRARGAEDYVAAVEAGREPPCEEDETLAPRADAVERAIFALRLAEGIDTAALQKRFPAQAELFKEWDATLALEAQRGLAEKTRTGAWRLTSRGREVCDAILGDLPLQSKKEIGRSGGI